MAPRYKTGSRLGWVLVALLSGCGGDEGEQPDGSTPIDASSPTDAGGDAATDAGSSDAGPSDAGPSDAGPSDAGPSDAGPSDAGPSGTSPDAGYDPFDAGPYDAGPYEPYDAGPNAPDAGPSYVWFMVDLTSGAEVPPCASAGPAASGTAYGYVAPPPPAAWEQMFVSLSWRNLSSPLTMAHIHYGASDANGPVVLPFTNLTSPVSAQFSAMEYLAAPGAPISFDAFRAEVAAGKAYVNLHTQSCPNGELRGQITLVNP